MTRSLMRGLCLALAGLSATAAIAADLPTRKEAPPPIKTLSLPVPQSWTGFYVGAYGGLNWLAGKTGEYAGAYAVPNYAGPSTVLGPSVVPATVATPYGAVKYGRSGMVRPEVGALAGYLYDMGAFGAGVELNGGYSWAKGRPRAPWSAYDGAERAKANGALRARFGFFAPNKSVFFYATGGVSLSQLTRDFSTPGLAFRESGNRVGWTAGLGAEGRIWGATRLRAEYVFENYGARKTEIHKARLGLIAGF